MKTTSGALIRNQRQLHIYLSVFFINTLGVSSNERDHLNEHKKNIAKSIFDESDRLRSQEFAGVYKDQDAWVGTEI